MININQLNQNNEYSLGTPNIQVKRSTLKMRETIQSSGTVGKIIPLTVHETLPSETTRLGTQINMEFSSWATNIIHEINGEIQTWYVPYRIIWEDWEKFITGCDEENDITDGTLQVTLPTLTYQQMIKLINNLEINEEVTENIYGADFQGKFLKTLKEIYPEFEEPQDPTYKNRANNMGKQLHKYAISEEKNAEFVYIMPLRPIDGNYSQDFCNKCNIAYSTTINEVLQLHQLTDYYGLPLKIDVVGGLIEELVADHTDTQTNSLLLGMNNNNLWSKSDLYTYLGNDIDNIKCQTPEEIIDLNFRAYNKIYNDWTRQLDWQPKRELLDLSVADGKYAWDMFTRARRYQLRGAMPTVPVGLTGNINGSLNHTVSHDQVFENGISKVINNNNVVKFGYNNTYTSLQDHDLNNTKIEANGEWNILDMLTPAGILNYYMANAKIKPRYANQLLARWGIEIQDERYQYAQYISSGNITITQNGITQTAPQQGDSTAQGNITGQGWGEGSANCEFFSPEHGVILQLLVIRPSNAYEEGFNAQYTKKTRFDYPTPELVDTPDVQIKKSELAPLADRDAVLGWRAIYDEYRTKFNKVTGLLRPSLGNSLGIKTLARYWIDTIDMENLITCKSNMNRVKMYTTQPDFLFIKETNFANSVPLPYINDPRIFI